MPSPWLPRARPHLGKLSDHEIDRRVGVARTIVSKAWRQLGIAPAHHRATTAADRSWVPTVRHLLGKMSDREVGKRVGRSAATVGEARRELGIARSQRRPRVRGRSVVLLPDALLPSKRSAPEIASMTGVAVQTIYWRRSAMGIETLERLRPKNERNRGDR